MSQDKLSVVFTKCREDAAYKERFLSEPAATLAAEGFDVPEGVEVKIVENVPGTLHIVLPSFLDPEGLSDDDLESIAGGAWGSSRLGSSSMTPTSNIRDLVQMYTRSSGKDCVPW